VPEEFRVALIHAAKDAGVNTLELIDVACRAQHQLNSGGVHPTRVLQTLVFGCQWWEVFDLCEALFKHINRSDGLGRGSYGTRAISFQDTTSTTS